MKKRFFSILCLTSLITTSSQAQILEYVEYIANGAHSSATNVDAIFKVTKDDKSTIYRYSTGRYSGLVEKLCTGETFPFQIRAYEGKAQDANAIWSPLQYFEAYYNITNKDFEPGIRMVKIKKDNEKIDICMEDKENCYQIK